MPPSRNRAGACHPCPDLHMTKNAADKNLLLMAEIVGVHGIKGAVKLKVFGDDPDALMDKSLSDAAGKASYEITRIAPHGNIYLADIKGIADRNASEKLRGVKLYLPRTALPKIKKKDTYYHADLIGMTAKHIDGQTLGTVIAVANFGAGDLLDIKPAKGNSFYVPFTDSVVPDVNVKEKTLVVDPPEGLL